MLTTFDLQGHRGARGLKPENTLPSFECAFDLGVSSIELDLHLSRDGVPIVVHDPVIHERLFRKRPYSTSPDPIHRPAVRELTLSQLRGYQANVHPDPVRFPLQDSRPTPLASLFAEHHEIDPYALPTLADLFAWAVAYGGELGVQAGKTPAQRMHSQRIHFDLELKCVPFRLAKDRSIPPDQAVQLLENQVLETVRAAGMLGRTRVRSFDHRCVRRLRQKEPRLLAAVLVAGTAPVDPVALVRAAEATAYGPDYEFLDEEQVRQCHAAGIKVWPWTVNDEADWHRLLDWGVDGITTDYPDRLATWLRQCGISF